MNWISEFKQKLLNFKQSRAPGNELSIAKSLKDVWMLIKVNYRWNTTDQQFDSVKIYKLPPLVQPNFSEAVLLQLLEAPETF